MQRLVRVLAILSLLLLGLTGFVWVFSFFESIHVGSHIVEIDPYGTQRVYRRGMFFSDGHVVYAYGTDVQWLATGSRPPPSSVRRVGVFFGRYDLWDGSPRWPLGFGSYRGGASAPTIGRPSKLGDLTIVSMWIGVWAIAFAALPAWVWFKPRHRIQGGTLVAMTAVYLALAILTSLAIAATQLAGLIVGYLGLIVAWLVVAAAVRRWRLARARRFAGRCRVCGYDLRATPDPAGPLLERCPECGTYSRPLV